MKTLLTTLLLLALAGGALAQTDIFISEYIEGSSYNKAIEIYNATDQDLDLSRVTIETYFNGSLTTTAILTLAGTLAAGDVWVIAHPSSIAAILAVADQTSSTVANFNGDDTVLLYLDGVVVDSIGKLGFDPGTMFGTEPITTVNHTLVRKLDACDGDADPSDDYDPAVTFDSYAVDTSTYLGFHTTGCLVVPDEVNSFGSVKSLFR